MSEKVTFVLADGRISTRNHSQLTSLFYFDERDSVSRFNIIIIHNHTYKIVYRKTLGTLDIATLKNQIHING